MNSLQHLTTSLILLSLTVVLGLIGYQIIEGWSFSDSFYMTIITLSTVGFGEIHNLSGDGRLFTAFLIFFAVVLMAYFTASMARILLEGELLSLLGRRKMETKIKQLENHYIICGFGRIGKLICEELHNAGKSFIVIENDVAEIQRNLEKSDILFIQDDATNDEALILAGIKKAKSIVTAVRSDAENVFITLTARELNPSIYILSRASDSSAERKLKIAGASKVVSPYTLGGKRMVSALLRPNVTDFLETTTNFSREALQIEEISVEAKSPFLSKTLRDANLREKFEVIIVAVKTVDGEMIFNPGPDQLISLGEILIVLGRHKDLIRMGKVF